MRNGEVPPPSSVPSSADDAEAPELVAAIMSLHARIDDLHHVVQRLEVNGTHAEGWLHDREDALIRRTEAPAWRRRTRGEVRWPVTACVAVGIALQIAVPDRLVLVHPFWVLPAVQGALLVVLVAANPHRIDRPSTVIRWLSLLLAALLSLANAWSVVRLCQEITNGSLDSQPNRLLITGAVVWLTNVVAFALWYWEFDRGGPVSRALNIKRYPDFQFVQMVSPPEMVPPEWEPAFIDYLFLAFTNAAAFSPTDVMPLSRWAKIAMTVQSVISIVTVALVISRAVNILKLSPEPSGMASRVCTQPGLPA